MPIESQPQTDEDRASVASSSGSEGKVELFTKQTFIDSTKWKRSFLDYMVKQYLYSGCKWYFAYIVFLSTGVLLSFFFVNIANLTVGGAPYIKLPNLKMNWKDMSKFIGIIVYTVGSCIFGGYILHKEFNGREIFLDNFFDILSKRLPKLTKNDCDSTLIRTTLWTTASIWIHILLFGFTVYDIQLYESSFERFLAAFSCFVMIIPHSFLIEMSFICWILITLETQLYTQVKQLVGSEPLSKAEIENKARSHHKFSILVNITNKEKKHMFGCIFIFHCFYFALSVCCWLLASDWTFYWSIHSFIEACFNLAIFLLNSLYMSQVGSKSLKILFHLESMELNGQLELSSKIKTFKDRLRQDIINIEVSDFFRATRKNLLKIILYDLVFMCLKITIYALRFFRKFERIMEANNHSEAKVQ